MKKKSIQWAVLSMTAALAMTACSSDDSATETTVTPGTPNTVTTPSLNITSPAVGQVIGSDGKNYAAGSVPSGVDKVAMIAYVSGSNGLAIALADEGYMNWTSAVSTAAAHTPIFTGGTWKLPSKSDWMAMFSANGGNERQYSGLNSALATAGGDSSKLHESDEYWSSSEVGGVGSGFAYYVYLRDSFAYWDGIYVRNLVNRVRACLAF